MKPKPDWKGFPGILAKFGDLIWELIVERTPQPGSNMQGNESPSGIMLSVDQGSLAKANVWPLKGVSFNDSGTKKVRIYYGLLAGEPVDGMSPGDKPPFLFDVSGAGVIYGHVEIDISTNPNGDIVTREILQGATKPPDDSTNAYVEICSFSKSGQNLDVAPSVTGSQAYEYCAGNHLFGVQ